MQSLFLFSIHFFQFLLKSTLLYQRILTTQSKNLSFSFLKKMRIDSEKPLQILIIKTSSLGDIIQALYVLDYLHAKFSNVAIDWVIENSFQMIVASHPLIRSAIPIETKGLKKE